MTAGELARKINKPYTTVATWLRKGQVPGAVPQTIGDFRIWMVPEEAADTFPQWQPKPGRPTFRERLSAIAAEIREELSDQYADFDLQPEAQDSVDGQLTYKAHSGKQVPVLVVRRSGQTDDEIKDEIRAQLLPKTDGPRRASKKAAKKSKKGSAK